MCYKRQLNLVAPDDMYSKVNFVFKTIHRFVLLDVHQIQFDYVSMNCIKDGTINIKRTISINSWSGEKAFFLK